MSITARASLRYLARHRWQPALLLLSVALGVAMVVAVDLANESARRAFSLSLDRLTGEATHQILASAGDLDERLYVELRLEGWRPSAPVVEGHLRARGETLRLIGLDPFAEREVRGQPLVPIRGGHLDRLLTESGTVLLAGSTARRWGLGAGQSLNAEIAGRRLELAVIGLLEADGDQGAALDGLLLADIATAQEILDRVGRLDRIDLRLDDPDRPGALRERLPEGVQLLSADSRNAASQQITRAFTTNLQAMSLLALVVGMFLIYNSMTFSVLQRRGLIATLRALGVGRAQVFRLVLAEAALFGALGAAAGLGLGLLLAQGLLGLVTRTINDLYFVLTVTELLITPWPLLKGLLLGVGASVLAGLLPALEAARTQPSLAQRRSSIETRSHRALPWLAGAGALAVVLALALLALPGGSLLLGFGALFLIILGCSLWAPLAVVWLTRATAATLGRRFGHVGRMAVRGVEASLSRTGIAITALAVAVSATVGVGVMVGSFRAAVEQWLGQTLRADVYLSLPRADSGRHDEGLTAGLLARLRALPGVADISHGRRVHLATESGPLELLVLAPGARSEAGFRWRAGDGPSAWRAFTGAGAVLVSEPYAYHHRVAPGDRILLPTDLGPREFPVAGVFADYGSDRGMLLLHRATYERHWRDRAISTVGLYLDPGADVEAVVARLREELADAGSLLISSTAAIRRASMAVFDRTFAITNVLRLLAIGIAFVGILGALMALQLERARELAILRATGYTPAQIWTLVGVQTGYMGLCAALLAIPLGLVMSRVLIDVINRRSFGWSMDLLVPGGVMAEALWLALGAALLAGLYPGWRMATAPPAAALREE